MGREADVDVTRTGSAVRSPSSTARLLIPDVLRGVAILAMLIAHASAFVPDKPAAASFVTAMFSEMASPLFALVMGMSAQLVWNRRPSVPLTVAQQVLRGLLLIALGVWMATWGSWVAIVLAHLGVLLIVGVPILLARTPWVIAIAAGVLVISDPLLQVVRTWSWAYATPSPLRDVLEWTAVSPYYRLINLLPFFLLGALLLRHGLRRDRLLWVLGAIGIVSYLTWAAVVALDLADSVSGNYIDTLRDIGLVLTVYVCVVLAATVRRERAERVWNAIFVPLRAAGQVALSLYVLHVALIALWNNAYGRPTDNVYLGWFVIVPGMILVGWLWWRFVGTGPVEWAMGLISGRRKRWRSADRRESDVPSA